MTIGEPTRKHNDASGMVSTGIVVFLRKSLGSVPGRNSAGLSLNMPRSRYSLALTSEVACAVKLE
jgi:hypothetical protein